MWQGSLPLFKPDLSNYGKKKNNVLLNCLLLNFINAIEPWIQKYLAVNCLSLKLYLGRKTSSKLAQKNLLLLGRQKMVCSWTLLSYPKLEIATLWERDFWKIAVLKLTLVLKIILICLISAWARTGTRTCSRTWARTWTRTGTRTRTRTYRPIW